MLSEDEVKVRLSQSPSLLVSGSVVGPSVKDFYPLRRAKFTRGIFLLWVLSNQLQFLLMRR